jgi:glycosyltransferase involved in cell wall biosynthesis
VETDHLKPIYEAQDYLLFAGRLAPEKGLKTLIAAAAKSGVKLVIAGTGPDEAELKALAAERNAPVTFAGYVTGEKLHRLIGEARALVLPSEWYENAPVSILEAYALGTPVIGARIGGIPEMIRDGETGLTAEAGNAEDLAKQLSHMAALPVAERNAMGLAGREWILNEFSADAYRNRMLELYGTLGVGA